MLNEDKIKQMTEIATFEKKEGKWIFPLQKYFKEDYVSRHVFSAFFGYSLCYVLCVMIWALYHIDSLLNASAIEDMVSLAWKVGILYFAGLVVYLGITAAVYKKRYEYGARGMKLYLSKLRRLDRRYDIQEKAKTLEKGGRRL